MTLLERLKERFPNDSINFINNDGHNFIFLNDKKLEVVWYDHDDLKLKELFGKSLEDEIFSMLVEEIENSKGESL